MCASSSVFFRAVIKFVKYKAEEKMSHDYFAVNISDLENVRKNSSNFGYACLVRVVIFYTFVRLTLSV